MEQNTYYLEIANFVRAERARINITQTELAEISDTSLGSIVAIEKGRKVRQSTIDKVLAALKYRVVITPTFIPLEDNQE